MTQVSIFGDGDGVPTVGEYSDDSDDEDLQQQIARKVADQLPEASFDIDTSNDEGSDNDSRISSASHNNSNGSGFLFNQKQDKIPHHSPMTKAPTTMNGRHGNGNFNNVGMNGVNFNMMPNTIADISSENPVYPLNVNGNSSSPNYGVATTLNGNIKLNGNLLHGNGTSPHANTSKPKKQVTIVESFQKNRSEDEMEESNATISLLHRQHCPRKENGPHNGNLNNEMLLAAENKEEHMQLLLDTKTRQLERNEEEVLKLQKDKRSLQHENGLFKTHLKQMENQQADMQQAFVLKEQECEKIRRKLHEVIDDFENTKAREVAATDQNAKLTAEVEQLQQQVILLSKIGSSAHQTELNDIVRQIREKHATEIVAWKKVVNDLEGQIRTHKRQQQLLAEQSFTDTNKAVANSSCQTDDVHFEEQHKTRESTKMYLKDVEGDFLIKEKKIISLTERLEEIQRKYEEEKDLLNDCHEKEIAEYRMRLAVLPDELFKKWSAVNAEYGLNASTKPICVDAYTSMTYDDVDSDSEDNYPRQSNDKWRRVCKTSDAEVQVNFASTMTNCDNATQCGNQPDNANSSLSHKSSSLVQTEEKETSHAFIQTDETAETYKVLASLLETWAHEVQTAKANEEESVVRCRRYEEEINKLQVKFKTLHKIATKCRKESKVKEETLNKEIDNLKMQHMKVLQELTAKLDLLA